VSELDHFAVIVIEFVVEIWTEHAFVQLRPGATSIIKHEQRKLRVTVGNLPTPIRHAATPNTSVESDRSQS